MAEAVVRASRAVPLAVVHGGGKEIDAALAKAGIPKQQVDGLRVTDQATLDVVVAVHGRGDQHAVRRGDQRRRRARGRPDGRGRGGRRRSSRRRRSRAWRARRCRWAWSASRSMRARRTCSRTCWPAGTCRSMATIGADADGRALQRERRHDGGRRGRCVWARRGWSSRGTTPGVLDAQNRTDRRRLIAAGGRRAHRGRDGQPRHARQAAGLPRGARRRRRRMSSSWTDGDAARLVAMLTGDAAARRCHDQGASDGRSKTARIEPARAADLSPRSRGVHAGRRRVPVRRRRWRVPRPALRHRRRVARPREPGAGRRARRAGARRWSTRRISTSTDLQGQVASRLASLSGLSRTFFCNSGTEAMEGCLKFARRYWHTAGDAQRTGLVALEHAFHGRTMGVAVGDMGRSLSRALPAAAAGRGRGCRPTILRRCRRPSPGRPRRSSSKPSRARAACGPSAPEFARGREGRAAAHRRAAHLPTKCSAASGGPASAFGYQRLGLEPDLVAVGKALGGGMPVGAVLVSERVAQAVSAGDHGSTYGGNLLACRAALVFLDAADDRRPDDPRAGGRGAARRQAWASWRARTP